MPPTSRPGAWRRADRPRGGPRLERPRLSAPAASNLDVATGPPGAAGLPDVRARAGCPRRTRPVSPGEKRSTSRRQRMTSCTTMISAFRRAGALPVVIACAWDRSLVPSGSETRSALPASTQQQELLFHIGPARSVANPATHLPITIQKLNFLLEGHCDPSRLERR